jgi:uncharacterized protein YhaN
MVLNHLELKRFKCWQSLSLDFSPGLNVISGPNESGKSTLRAALLAVLFGNPTSVSEAVERWTSWGQAERCELTLAYTNRAGVGCRLRKDFADHKVFLIVGEESFKTAKVIQQEITNDLGIPSEEFYALCASLDSKTLADLGQARKQVGKMLAGLMTGAESGGDVLQAIKRLDEALKELNKGLSAQSKTPGPVKEARERLVALGAERRRLETDLEARRAREEKFAALNQSVLRDQELWQNLEQVLAANRKLAEARKRQAELAQQDQGFEQGQQKRKRLEQELAELRSRQAVDPLAALKPADWEAVRAAAARNAQLPAESPAEPAAAAPAASWVLPAGLILAVLGLLLVWKWIGLGALTLVAGLLVSFLGWQQQRGGRILAQSAAENRRHRQQLAEEAAQARQAWIDRTGLNPEELLAALPASQKLAQDLAGLERSLREIEAVDEARWSLVRRELRLVQDTLDDPGMLTLALQPQEVVQKERERQTLGAQLEDNRRQRDRLQAILDHDALNQDLLAEGDEKIAETKERLAYLEQQARVGQLAAEGLEQARRATLHPARQILETEAGRLLALISRGRYTQVTVDDEDLACRVFIPETQHWEDPAILSQGTFDQFYLSLRLALGDILAGGKRPPLLLDDPFALFDPERQGRFLDWLKLRSQEQQVLLFTCRPDYAPWADRLVDLEKVRGAEAGAGKQGR